MQFDQAFVFRYSPGRTLRRRNARPGARARQGRAEPGPPRPRRLDRRGKNHSQVGTTQEVLCEGPSRYNAARLSGRTRTNRIVIFDGDPHRMAGQLFDVHITESSGFTLYGDGGDAAFRPHVSGGISGPASFGLAKGRIRPTLSGLPPLMQAIYHLLYEPGLPLKLMGVLVGLWLVASHLFALLKPALVKPWLARFPRNDKLGAVIVAVCFAWSLVIWSSMDLGEFYKIERPVQMVIIGIGIGVNHLCP